MNDFINNEFYKSKNDRYDLYHEFDPELHTKTYINYLEIVIHSDEYIEYAVPSHQEN